MHFVECCFFLSIFRWNFTVSAYIKYDQFLNYFRSIKLAFIYSFVETTVDKKKRRGQKWNENETTQNRCWATRIKKNFILIELHSVYKILFFFNWILWKSYQYWFCTFSIRLFLVFHFYKFWLKHWNAFKT